MVPPLCARETPIPGSSKMLHLPLPMPQLPGAFGGHPHSLPHQGAYDVHLPICQGKLWRWPARESPLPPRRGHASNREGYTTWLAEAFLPIR